MNFRQFIEFETVKISIFNSIGISLIRKRQNPEWPRYLQLVPSFTAEKIPDFYES